MNQEQVMSLNEEDTIETYACGCSCSASCTCTCPSETAYSSHLNLKEERLFQVFDNKQFNNEF